VSVGAFGGGVGVGELVEPFSGRADER